MNWTELLRLAVDIIGIVALVALVFKVVRYSPTPSTSVIKTVLLIAATTCGTTLFFIGAKMIDLGQDVTVVDIAAMAITGILTGCFLTFGLKFTHKNEGKT